MNGFIQEVATQGELLGQAAAYYREGDGKGPSSRGSRRNIGRRGCTA